MNERADIYSAPDLAEIEVSVFGPGYGEAIVIHIGNGKWIIIDSCFHPDLSDPTPLAYLRELKVDVAKDVALIVASHWHDDHIRGLSRIVEACISAKFVCPAAMVGKEFLALGETYAAQNLEGMSGAKEFIRIHALLANRTLIHAIANRRLLSVGPSGKFSSNVQLFSLSPTDSVMGKFLKLATSLISPRTSPKTIAITPNHVAVVLQLLIDSESILLGSDLEDTTHGWRMIIEDTARPQDASIAFKVAHHGSTTGHNDGIWNKMLVRNAYAFLTPFARGKTVLPTPSDIARVRNLTSKGYMTANPAEKNSVKPYPKDVQRTIQDHSYKFSRILMTRGHIRFRFYPGKNKSRKVDLFFGASLIQ